jgi:hypothetical protein
MLLSACGLGVDPFPNEDLFLLAFRVQIAAPPYPLIADGLDKISFEVRFQDLRNRGVAGIVPSFGLSGSGGLLTCDPSNAQGVALCFLSSSISGVTQLTLLEPAIPVAPISIEAVGTDAFQYRIQGGGTVDLPLLATGATYSGLKVYWGDGTSSPISDASDPARFHTYTDSSERVVTLTGSFNRLSFFGHGPERLLDVRFWGSNGFISFTDMFNGCNQLTAFSTLDPPNTAGVLDSSGAFENATEFNGDIGAWNVSAATNLSRMFKGARKFDQNLELWQVGNVDDFSEMFMNATQFNNGGGSLSWNTISATDMSYMFFGATTFSQVLAFQVGTVKDFDSMFFGASTFNGDISSWNVTQARNLNSMFRDASSFNQNLSGWSFYSIPTSANFDLGARSWATHKKPRLP